MGRKSSRFCCFFSAAADPHGSAADQLPPSSLIEGGGNNPTSTSSLQGGVATTAQPQLQPQNQTETVVVSINELKSIFANHQIEEDHLLSVLHFVKQAISKLKHVDVASSSSSSSLSRVANDAVSHAPDLLRYLSTTDSMASPPDAQHHRATLQMLSGVLGVMGSLHWVFAGLSVAACVLNQTLLVSINQEEARNLLDELESLASHLVEFHKQFSSENKTLKRAIEVIIKGTIACCRVDHCPRYIGKLYRFIFANASGDLLSSLCKEISTIDRALMNEYNIEIMKRNPKVSSPNKPEYVEEAVVGLKTRVEDAMQLIRDEESSTTVTPQSQPESHPCCALILHGIGGIGKSTLLTALSSKLLDLRPNYKYAYVSLHLDQTEMKPSQEVLWQHLIGSKCKFDDENDGRIKLSKELKKLSQPVLLVIDNALKNEQLQELLPQGLNVLLCGSVILVTTRDAGVGNELKRKGVKLVHNYEVLNLSEESSKELLLKTMDKHLVKYMEEENLRFLIEACDGHPLALTIAANYINDEVEDIGRDLGGRCKYVVESISEMRGEGRIREGKLLDALAYSVTTLPTDSKEAFFDIVFISGNIGPKSFSWDEMRDIVGVDAFKKLCNRSLIKKTRHNRVGVHDLLRRLALREVPEGSRFRNFEEFQPLLDPHQQEKLRRIECLDLSWGTNQYLKQNLSSDMFKKMDGLRLLIMPYGLGYDESDWQYKISPQARLQLFIGSSLHELPLSRTDNLRFLYIWGSPRLDPANLFSAANFNFASLVILYIEQSMTNSTILPANLWNMLPNIKYLGLHGFDSLTRLPHKRKGELTSLVMLSLSGCKVLKTLPEDLFCNSTVLQVLDLSDCESLEELPQKRMGELTRLERLLLSGCKLLKTLPEDLFCNLPSLKELDLSDCKSLEELPKKGMGELTCLQILSLSRCKVLKILPEDLFYNLSSLEELDLSDCKSLEELPKKGTGEFACLKRLLLSRCKVLKTLPEDLLCNLPSLQELDLSDCESLEEMPWKVNGGLTHLKKLIFSRCKLLKTLPEDLFCNLPSLQELDLSDCEILEELPKKEMGEFARLRRFMLRRCKVLKTLPEDLFCNLPSLEELDLSECESLEEMPQKVKGGLTCLKKLLFSRCEVLKTLPEDLFCNLPSLEELDLSDCKSLEELPKKGVGKFARLELLSLSGCKVLKTLPEDLFCNIPSLAELDLSDCESLEEMPRKVHGGLTRLEKLLLSRCKVLKNLPEDIFCNLPSLEELDLSDCESLEEMPQEVHGGLTRLEKLFFSRCKMLKTLPEDLFCNLPSLEELDLSDCESLEELPKKGMGEFTRLEFFSLSGCKVLKMLPEDLFCNIPSLEELDLSDCDSLEELPQKVRGGLPHLKKLSLPGWKLLHTLPEDLTCTFTSLKELDICPCGNLEEMPYNVMGGFTCIRKLLLSSGFNELKYNLYEDLSSISESSEEELNLSSIFESPNEELDLSLSDTTEEIQHKAMGGWSCLEKISLWRCKVLKTLPEDLFCNIPSLEELDLSGCDSLEELPQKVTRGLTCLIKLSLPGWKLLNTLPEDLTYTFTSLKELDICPCGSLEEIPSKVMGGLTCIKNLLMSSGYNELISESSSEVLDLSLGETSEDIQHKAMGGSPCLEKISLWRCKMIKGTLPEDLFCTFTSLKELYLVECDGLEELPHKGMKGLTSLELLSLEGCKALKMLPDDLFCNLTSLEHLDLSGCESLEELPNEGIGKFYVLKFLSLEGCKALKMLPDDLFCNLTSLEHLDLSRCESLEELPNEGIGKLYGLKFLSLEGCKALKMLPNELFRNLTSLQHLDLSGCESLEKFPHKAREGLTRLKFFSLKGCTALMAPRKHACNSGFLTYFRIDGYEGFQLPQDILLQFTT